MRPRLSWPLQKLRLTRNKDVATAAELLSRLNKARRNSVLSFWRARIWVLVAAWTVASTTASSSCAQQAVAGVAPSGDLAEFIVNMARYTSWPKAATPKTLSICYAHGGALPTTTHSADQISSVKSMPITWHAISTPQQTSGCHIVWLNSDVRPAPREWLNAVNDQPILSLSNYADFTADGGIIGAYRVGADWRFEVNLEALQRSQLNIAAVALRLSQKRRSPSTAGAER